MEVENQRLFYKLENYQKPVVSEKQRPREREKKQEKVNVDQPSTLWDLWVKEQAILYFIYT